MLAVIDGDVLAYQACESRWRERCDGHSRIIALDEEGEQKALEFTKAEDTKYLRKSWDRFQKDLDDILEKVYATDYVMAVKGPHNFRNILYPDYKMNRHKDLNKSNLFVPILRTMAVNAGLAIEALGREADDLMRIWAEESRAAGIPHVICTIDKDLKCIPGMYYKMHIDSMGRRMTQEERLIEISEDYATRFYYEQLLKGDPTDAIPGVPRIGEMKAAKIIKRCNTEEDMQEAVVNEYFNAYGPDEWYDYLLSNGKMIYLQKHLNDYFSCLDWPVVQELLGYEESENPDYYIPQKQIIRSPETFDVSRLLRKK
jgi:5'-3' exonuclease